MIFVAGHKFVFNPMNRPVPAMAAGSVQDQMAARQFKRPREFVSPFDPRFMPGHTYRVGLIRKITEQDIVKVRYLFTDITDESQPDIDVVLANTGAGDEYIASISGATKTLQEERAAIAKAAENNTDF